MRNFDSDEEMKQAIRAACEWLLQVASEHACDNVLTPLIHLFHAWPDQILTAAIHCDSFKQLLPEMVARNAIPRQVVIEGFRQSREHQTPEQSAEAAARFDELLPILRKRREEMRSEQKNPNSVVAWMNETGISAEEIVERLYESGRLTVPDLDDLFPEDDG